MMTSDAYLTHRRSIFYPKTDEPVNKTRHHIDWGAGRPMLRRYSMVEHDYSMMAEARVVAEVSKTGVPVIPMTVHFEPKQSYQEMAPARGVSIASLQTVEERKAAYADLGRVLAVLHTVKVDGCGLINPFEPHLVGLQRGWANWGGHLSNRLEEHVHYATHHGLINEGRGYCVERAIMDRAGPFTLLGQTPFESLLHGDLSDHNVFVQQDAITAIIDWEDALGGDPLFDLAYWATFVNHTPDTHASLLDAYFAYSGDKPADFNLRFWTYYLRIALSKLVQLHRYGVPDLTQAIARIETGLNHCLPL